MFSKRFALSVLALNALNTAEKMKKAKYAVPSSRYLSPDEKSAGLNVPTPSSPSTNIL